MKITTPSATLGIRGTTGVVDVPQGGAPGAAEPRIKLYPTPTAMSGRSRSSTARAAGSAR